MKFKEINPIAQFENSYGKLITVETKADYYIIRRWRQSISGWREDRDPMTIFADELKFLVDLAAKLA